MTSKTNCHLLGLAGHGAAQLSKIVSCNPEYFTGLDVHLEDVQTQPREGGQDVSPHNGQRLGKTAKLLGVL